MNRRDKSLIRRNRMIKLAGRDVNFIDLDDPNLKINITNKEMAPFKTIPQEEKGRGASRKPSGLWYSCGNTWLDWVRYEMPQWMDRYEFMYAIEPDYTEVCKLASDEMAKAFARKYGMKQDVEFVGGRPQMVYRPVRSGGRIEMINWALVSLDFSGVELCPLPRWGDELDWVYGWDIPSGCIWDWGGIKDYHLIGYKQDNGKWWIEGPGEPGEEREFKGYRWDEDEDEEEEAA